MIDIIPAIDLKQGRCVRLIQGREEDSTEYSDNPVSVAIQWAREGALRIHVVNLDGAFGRASRNLEILRDMSGNVTARIQYGGGLRTQSDIAQAVESGASKVILGTAALENTALLETALRRWGPEAIIVALDARKGVVASRGWNASTGRPLLDVARQMHDIGVREILYTDIDRDGMLSGPDTEYLPALANTGLRILVSGGIGTAADVRSLAELNIPEVSGVIIGKALYEGRIDLRKLIAEVR